MEVRRQQTIVNSLFPQAHRLSSQGLYTLNCLLGLPISYNMCFNLHFLKFIYKFENLFHVSYFVFYYLSSKHNGLGDNFYSQHFMMKNSKHQGKQKEKTMTQHVTAAGFSSPRCLVFLILPSLLTAPLWSELRDVLLFLPGPLGRIGPLSAQSLPSAHPIGLRSTCTDFNVYISMPCQLKYVGVSSAQLSWLSGLAFSFDCG